VGAYKAAVTRQARQQGLINSPLWQERYHDHIIRNEHGYQQISQYIEQNPARWHDDTFYVS
jgi:REP element-mobilizing transposase RayT